MASPTGTSYRQLSEKLIVETIERLRDRVEERFPGSGLGRVAAELIAISREAADCLDYIRRPNWPLRAMSTLAITGVFALLVIVGINVPIQTETTGLFATLQAVEAAINDIIFLAVAVFFLITIEGRLKRRRALNALHELRSVVHIVDMHQLTKDLERLLAQQDDTPSSPVRTMSSAELGRYLDYCTELLSLASKLAALYVQHLNDPVVLAAVNEIENLAGSLSNQIWQKIALLEPAAARSRTRRSTIDRIPPR